MTALASHIAALLVELHAIDEKIADRVPLKVLPRPAEEIPDVPKLRARQTAILADLRVRRTYTVAKGHDLDSNGAAVDGSSGRPYLDLAAVGIAEEVRTIAKGQDRALPTATTVVRVRFPTGEHLWFDVADLKAVPAASSSKAAAHP